jgi:hypothetical protein
VHTIYLPIKISELERLAMEATENPVYMDGELTVFIGDYFTGEGVTFFIGNNTAEDNAKVMDVIRKTNRVRPADSVVYRIIGEEVGAYIAGQKSPDEVVDIIENRVNLYLSEIE